MTVYLLLALNIVLLVGGQLVWKTGLDRLGGLQIGNWLRVITSPLILAGIFLYAIATVCWLAVLSRLPLSIAYPLQSLAYILGVAAAYAVFHETIPLNRWIGAGIIMVGIFVLSWK